MTELPNDVETLKGLIKELLEENAQLKTATAELRRRLGLDSNTSHPAAMATKKRKTVKPGVPKEKNNPKGGQKGHQGNTLKRVEQPKQQLIHHPKQCHCCSRQFRPDEVEIIQSRQVFDLVTPKLEMTEHYIGQIECCGLLHRGEYPAPVTASVQYGPSVAVF